MQTHIIIILNYALTLDPRSCLAIQVHSSPGMPGCECLKKSCQGPGGAEVLAWHFGVFRDVGVSGNRGP